MNHVTYIAIRMDLAKHFRCSPFCTWGTSLLFYFMRNCFRKREPFSLEVNHCLVFRFIRKTYTWSWRKSSYSWILRISWNLADFMRISWNPHENLIGLNQITQQKILSFMECSGKAMSHDFNEICQISHEIRQISWNAQRKTTCQEW